MSSNRRHRIVAVLLFLVGLSTRAEPVHCPLTVQVTAQASPVAGWETAAVTKALPLSSVMVYVGHPSQLTSLRGDEIKKGNILEVTWQFGQGEKNLGGVSL